MRPELGRAPQISPEPQVTVVIPTRNRWEELSRYALRSVLSQRGVRVRAIVVDDGSDFPPPDPSIFERDEITLVRLPQQVGRAAARNAGIELACDEWIALLDDDDIWAPDKLALLVEANEAAGTDFGYSSVVVVDAALHPTDLIEALPPTRLADALKRSTGICAIPSNLVVRRSLLTRLGGFDIRFAPAEDWEFLWRLAGVARGCSVAAPLLAYRNTSGALLADESAYRVDLHRLMDKHSQIRVDWHAFERWVAVSLRTAGRRREAAARYLSIAVRFGSARDLVHAATSMFDRGDRIHRWHRGGPLPSPQWLDLYRAEAR